jgi:hypothetical protein
MCELLEKVSLKLKLIHLFIRALEEVESHEVDVVRKLLDFDYIS